MNSPLPHRIPGLLRAFGVAALLGLWATALHGQDFAPGLTFANQTLLAPSFAGLVEANVSADLSHRIRRATDTDNFTTSVLSIDYPLNLKWYTGGAALILASDNAGGLRTNQAHLAFSYEVPKPARIRYHHLRAGFQVGVFQRTLESANLVFADQFSALVNQFTGTRSNDVLANQGFSTPLAFDAAFSLLFYRTQKIKGNPELNYFLGASYHHLNRPSIGFGTADVGVELSPRTTILGGLKYRTRSSVDVNLNAIYTSQNSSQLLTVGVFARLVFFERNVLFSNESASLIVGVNLRQQLNEVRFVQTPDDPATPNANEEVVTVARREGLESMVPYIGLELNRSFSFAVAYDQILASQTALTSSFGGVMFMASYSFGANKYKKPALPFPIF